MATSAGSFTAPDGKTYPHYTLTMNTYPNSTFGGHHGEGYIRVLTEYCDDDTFDQDIKIARVRNSFSVYMDPLIQDPCGSDAEWCFITSDEYTFPGLCSYIPSHIICIYSICDQLHTYKVERKTKVLSTSRNSVL